MSELWYTVDGPQDGPVLVLGGSLGSTTEMWQPQLAGLTARYRLVRYDHRGHGRSPVPPGPYTLEDLGTDVLAVLDRIGAGRVHLGGLSLGGMVGMWVAAHAPWRVDRLVLLCTSAKLGPPQTWADRAAAVRANGTASIADTVIGRWFTPEFAVSAPDTVTWAKAMFSGIATEGYASCCTAVEHMDLLPALGSITAPTLVIAGADDPATPPEHAYRIAAGIPDARVEVVPHAAHLSNVEQPDAVTGLLLDFLEGGDR